VANRFLRTSGLYFAGSAGSRVILAVLLPIYALFVEPDALGVFDFVQTSAAIAAPIFFLAVWESIIRFCMPTQAGDAAPTLLRQVARFSLGVCAIVLTLSVLALLTFRQDAYEFAAITSLAVSQGMASIWQYSARAMGYRRLFALSGIGSAAVNLTLVLILVVVLQMQFRGLWIAFIASQIFVVLLIEGSLRLTKGVLRTRIRREVLGPMLRFSTPLVLNLVSLLVLNGFGRILITLELTAADNGVYVFAMKVAALVSAVGTVFTMTSIEETVARIGARSMSSFFSSMTAGLWQLLLGLATLTVVGVMVMKPLLVTTEYRESFGLIPWMLMFTVLSSMSTNYGNAFQATLRMRYVAYTTIAGVVVCVPVSIILMNAFGVTGVAVGLCIGAATTLLSRSVGAHRMIGFDESPRILWVLGAFLAVSATAVADEKVSTWISGVVVIIATVVSVRSMMRAVRLGRQIPDEGMHSSEAL